MTPTGAWAAVDTPRWWRARCRIVVDDTLDENAHLSPLKIRGALRRVVHELTQDGAPPYRKRIWQQVVRRAIGSTQRKMRDRRQLELFS